MVTRRRRYIPAIILFAVIGAANSHTQEPAPGEPLFPLKAEMTGQITGSLYQLYLTADPSVVWKPGTFAVGIGTELIVGVSQFDMYLLPYLRMELAWVHLDFGYALTLLRPPGGDGIGGLSVGIAIAPKPFELAYGRFGFDFGLDFDMSQYGTAYESLVGSSGLGRVLGAALLSGRYSIGVSYSFNLL